MSSKEDSSQTHSSFSQKWAEGKNYFIESTIDERSEIFRWITTRNGLDSPAALLRWLAPRKRILDAGCGNGRVTSLLSKYSSKDARVIGIDFASHLTAAENLSGDSKVTIEFGDITEDLSSLGNFDLIYCQEVLHHTTNPKWAFQNLSSLLKDGGEIAIYVYKKKAVLREFADDYIRERISSLSYDETRKVIGEITVFAREVSKFDTKLSFPRLEILGVEPQQLSAHRFIYNNFFKNFWNDELTFEENFSINFDWYHPELCSRHSLAEIRGWFLETGLEIVHILEDDFGITVRGTRKQFTF